MSIAKRKIRVLYVIDTLAIGGAQQVVLTLARAIDRSCFDVSVCTLFSRDPSIEEPLFQEIRSLGIRTQKLGLWSWRDLQTMRRFVGLLREWNIDIVHGHSGYSSFWGGLFTRFAGKRRLIHTRHILYFPRGFISKLQSYLLVTVLTDKLVAISGSTYGNMVNTCRARPDKVIMISNPIDTQLFSPSVFGTTLREEFSIPLDAPVIGNTSRLQARKGYDVLFRAAAKLRPSFPNLKVIVAGYGPEEKRYLDMVAELGLEDMVVFLGARRDIPQVVAAMDVFVFTPYLSEGLSVCVLEAMASGKPVVASNVGSNLELIADGVSGFLPTPQKCVMETGYLDASAIAEKIAYLLENKEKAKRIGETGRRIVEEKFSTETVARRTEALYRDLVGRR